METRDMICIGCPLGCALTVTIGEDGGISVSGNTCPRGDEYARHEVTSPTRTVTSTVAVEGGAICRVSVKTRGDVPKSKIFECMAEIRRAKVRAPVEMGQTVIKNCAGTGVDVIATKSVPAAE